MISSKILLGFKKFVFVFFMVSLGVYVVVIPTIIIGLVDKYLCAVRISAGYRNLV